MNSVQKILKPLLKSRFLKFGAPFFVLVIGGSFGLREFSELRYKYSKKEMLRPEDVEKYGIQMKQPGEVTLETEFEKIKGLADNDWENIRGPRPWEENTTQKKV